MCQAPCSPIKIIYPYLDDCMVSQQMAKHSNETTKWLALYLKYCILGNFRGTKFSRFGHLDRKWSHARILIFEA